MKEFIFKVSIYIISFTLLSCNNSDLPEKMSDSEKEMLIWMNSRSGIEIPLNTKRLDYYPYIEYGKLFKFKLDSLYIDAFITKYNLIPINSLYNKIVLINEVEDDWYQSDLENIKPNEFYYLTDCRKGNVWNVLIQKSTRHLWYEILYPDHGGDEPECDKELI